jgi:hypothetical protein
MTDMPDLVTDLMWIQRDRMQRYLTGDLEWKLQFATHIDCECAIYMMVNRLRVLPALIDASVEQKEDVENVVCRFVRNLHQRHLDGHDIRNYYT